MPIGYTQALDYIHSFDDPYLAALRDHGKQTWGLGGIRALLERIGSPHLAYPTLHVAGTKGKGSTSALMAEVLARSGLKTGLYVSPHLEDWRERIQINRRLISRRALSHIVEAIQPAIGDLPLSAFEVTTALAFWHFAREGCDAAVIEVGLGGRLDATNVVEPLVSVITSISLDHTQLLGSTLAEIAGEKAAIIKRGHPAVSAPQSREALAAIEHRAATMGSHLTLIGRDWLARPVSLSWRGSRAQIGPPDDLRTYRIGLPGAFQVENAAVALAAVEEAARAGLPVTDQACRDGLARTRWPGRLEVIRRRPLVVIDGAHNPYSVAEVVSALHTLLGERMGQPALRPVFVFGCMADKDMDGMLRELLPAARRVIFTQAAHTRAALPGDLLERAAAILEQGEPGEGELHHAALGTAASTAQAIAAALEGLAPDDVLVITGSLSIAGEARTLLRSPASPVRAVSPARRTPAGTRPAGDRPRR